MNRKVRIYILAIVLSAGWYFLLGWADSGAMVRQGAGISDVCLSEYLPEGTVHEQSMLFPSGSYTFFPLGIECKFTMTDGSTFRSYHPSRGFIIMGILPMIVTLTWIGWDVIASSKRRAMK